MALMARWIRGKNTQVSRLICLRRTEVGKARAASRRASRADLCMAIYARIFPAVAAMQSSCVALHTTAHLH